MSNSTRFLSLFSPPPSSFLIRSLFSARITNLRRFHRRSSAPCSISLDNRRSLRLIAPSPPLIFKISLGRFHTHRVCVSAADFVPFYHNRLPEWTELVQLLSEYGYLSDSGSISDAEIEFFPGFPDEFLRPALACLALARDRPELLEMLSRRNVEVVVENGRPFLFRTGPDSLKKLRLYLRSDRQSTGEMLDQDKATTVDLMKLLLSYVGEFASFEGSKHHNQEIMEASVRSLLKEIANKSSRTTQPNLDGTMRNQFLDKNGQAIESFQKNIQMKRGDWICQRCSRMNFSRNVKCFQCEEARPKRQLTGSEWECPQCDFYNYGRNAACLRCDCKRPSDLSLNSTNSGYSNDPELEKRLAENEEKAHRWFSKVSQSNSNVSSADTDEDFPEIMPLRKGVNRFVVSTRKTPLEKTLTNAEQEDKTFETKTNRSLNEILGSDDKNLTSKKLGSSQESNFGFIPFVPLPSDMFARKPDKEETQIENNQSSKETDQEDSLNTKISSKETDQESEERSEKWFKRVTELHNLTDLETETTSEKASPEKMPMRKGENRFVVSRKKDRSLTSPAYKRRMAMEQSKDSDFIPFVPFPPGYFSKDKDPTKPIQKQPSSQTSTASGTSLTKKQPEEETTTFRHGKSLEGSLVKELDLLDMSEEAKAERWFKRVAEIKDISELSQIPDEDFPSIMPMRKGVNRFVISKRKTPLERRLASQRHRRIPPTTDFDISGKEDT